MITTLVYIAIAEAVGASRSLLTAFDRRIADVAILRGAYNRLVTLLGRDRADAMLREQAQRALYVPWDRYSTALSRGLSEAVWRAEHTPQPTVAETTPPVETEEASALANLKSSVFASLKREARVAGERKAVLAQPFWRAVAPSLWWWFLAAANAFLLGFHVSGPRTSTSLGVFYLVLSLVFVTAAVKLWNAKKRKPA